MNQVSQSIQIALLYSIKTDDAQDFILDKIDFLNKTTKQFSNTIKEDQILQVKGYFGTHKEVEREIELEINSKVNLQSYLNHSEKGNLITIKFENYMLFCLILSETFFISKPINEKAIEIVMFRILQDLTDNIKLCFNDDIMKKNWYYGDIIPFSQIQQRAEYYFAESENTQIQQYDCKWILSQKNNQNYQIINSQTLSPSLTRIRQLQFSQQEIQIFNQNYEKFIQQLLIQILNTKEKQTNSLMKIIKIEHQNKNLKKMLDELSDELEKGANHCIQNLIKQLVKNWKGLGLFTNDGQVEKQRIQFEQQVNNVLQSVEVSKQQGGLIYNKELIEQNKKFFEEQMKVFFQKLMEKLKGITPKYENDKKQIIEEYKKQTSYEVERISLKISRVDENEQGRVQNIYFKQKIGNFIYQNIFKNKFYFHDISQVLDDQQQTILNGNFLQLESSKFKVNDIFETKEKSRIYIITSLNDIVRVKTLIYFRLYKTPQIQLIKQLDFKDTEQAVYFHDYNRGHLYIFNFKQIQVLQIIITARGSIQNESQVYYQQESLNRFLVSHVAYLKIINKFIVLSTDNVVYKQQDQGQDFEKVKCKIQSKNSLQQSDFIPSIQQNFKYNQLLACPSGKYFYLANGYCCDRYDLNCLKMDCIVIEGPIKIFADFSDVIILGQLNQKDQNAKKAIIICNLVSQKKFNKQENNEKKVIGNPAIDIAKGSFIKFGPNSQFLLNEKNSTINVNVNSEYQYRFDKKYVFFYFVNWKQLGILKSQVYIILPSYKIKLLKI